MELFALCPKCELPIMGNLEQAMACPFCGVPLDPEDCHKDHFFKFLTDIRNSGSYEYEDIERLHQACDLLMEMNKQTCVQLAQTLKQLQTVQKRLRFYQDATELRPV